MKCSECHQILQRSHYQCTVALAKQEDINGIVTLHCRIASLYLDSFTEQVEFGVLYYSYIPTSCTSSRIYYILRKSWMLFFNMFSTPSQFGTFFSALLMSLQSHIWNTLLTFQLHTFFRCRISIWNIKMNIYTIFQNVVNTKSI